MPDELVPQFDTVKNLLSAMEIKTIGMQGYEADDIIGTLSRMAHDRGMKTKIITGDRDVFQLLNGDVEAMLTKRGISEIESYDNAKLIEQYSFGADKMVDLKGLMGDPSDNIPGIPSVGEKTAIKLLLEYGSLDGVLEHADEIKGKLGEKVRENRELAKLSRELARIKRDIPIKFTLDALKFATESVKNALPELKELKLYTILKKVGQMSGVGEAKVHKEAEIVEIKDDASVKSLASKIKAAKQISIYIGKDVHLSDGDTEYIIPVVHNLLDEGLDIYEIISDLKGVLESPVPKVAYDAKTMMHDLKKQGIELKNLAFDVYIAGLVLGRPARGGYKTLAENSLGMTLGKTPAALMIRLMDEQKNLLDTREQNKVFDEIEMPLIPIIYDLENDGL